MTEREIFEHALQIADADQRAAYVANACGNDQPLAARIDQLLSAHALAGSFLDVPAGAGNESADTQEQLHELARRGEIDPVEAYRGLVA